MKYNKIISITLFNAFTLLIFASLLSSCQKSKIKTIGLYTEMGKNAGRMPASVAPALDFDPKQIYIYCSIDSINSKQCYKQYFKQFLSESKSKRTSKEISEILTDYEYEKVEGQVNGLTEKILDQLEPKMTFFINKRTDFCEKNAKVNLRRCLNNNIESDTMKILNGHQQSVNLINGQEYLYLKVKIKQRLDSSYDNKLKHLQSRS